ncbi:MAG: GTP 3',8-cyclase MoaA [Bacillota bacterium]
MRDPFGRTIEYLRLSITKACDLRCIYCRPASVALASDEPELTSGEIETLVRHLVERHALKRVRLTGGEPTNRPDLLEIVQRLARVKGLEELAMTTNGLKLAELAKPLKEAGLTRVNVNLDTLVPEKFERMTGSNRLREVVAGIDAAVASGLTPVKLNTVVIRGENEYEIPELTLFAIRKGLEIRFIELMPMGPLSDRWQERFVPESEMRKQLSELVTTWRPSLQGPHPARRYRAGLPFGRKGYVSFVTAMTCPFCAACNRIRIAADGALYPCLMDRPAGSLLPALRPVFNADRFDEILKKGLGQKAQEHPATGVGVMTHIGG